MPGLAEQVAYFPANNRFRFDIENTGDTAADRSIEVTFSDRTGYKDPQTAFINIVDLASGGPPVVSFTAPTTIAVSDNPDPFFPPGAGADFVVTTDPASGISFFAGHTDDPFFFDVSGELQFRNSLVEAVAAAGGPGSPVPPGGFGNTDVELRGRDTFAGYNILSIALSVPKELLLGPAGSVIGVSGFTDRLREGTTDDFFQVDRQGFPVINVVLIGYERKRDYNRATPVDDANQMFATEIAGRLQELGTDFTNIGILAQAFILNGDQLLLDTSIPNPGPQGGNTINTGFLNFGGGRRLADNAPDALVNIISNQQFVGSNAVGTGINIGNAVNGVPDVDLVPANDDLVPANDDLFRDTFPFLAIPNQPQFPGVDANGNTIINVPFVTPVGVPGVDQGAPDDRTRN